MSFFASTCPRHPAHAPIVRRGRRQCPVCRDSAGAIMLHGEAVSIDALFGEPPTRTVRPSTGADLSSAILAAGWSPQAAANIGVAFDQYRSTTV